MAGGARAAAGPNAGGIARDKLLNRRTAPRSTRRVMSSSGSVLSMWRLYLGASNQDPSTDATGGSIIWARASGYRSWFPAPARQANLPDGQTTAPALLRRHRQKRVGDGENGRGAGRPRFQRAAERLTRGHSPLIDPGRGLAQALNRRPKRSRPAVEGRVREKAGRRAAELGVACQ